LKNTGSLETRALAEIRALKNLVLTPE